MAEKKFLDFLDRFDGGGMGKSGEKFEGGGLLSMLGNLLADPYGSDDKARMASRNAFYNAQGDAVPAPSLLAPRAGGNAAAKNNNQAAAARPAPPTDAQRFGMNPPAPYSPASVGAPPSYMQPKSMQTPINYDDGSGMTPANNYVPSSMPDGSPIEQLSQEQVYAKFGEDMSQKFGGSQANAIMSSPNGLAVFSNYVQNGYRLPDM